MIEMEDLFAEMKILHQRRSARALAQGVLVISDGRALLGGQRLGAIGSNLMRFAASPLGFRIARLELCATRGRRSEEHTSELQSLMRIPYAVFCLKKKTT